MSAFDEDYEEPNQNSKVGLKKVSSQKSIFDNKPKKTSQEDFSKNVQSIQDRASSYKVRSHELNTQFYKLMSDKTLAKNKNFLQQDIEKELMVKMVELVNDINRDPNEEEGSGAFVMLIPLMKTCFAQRDKINNLEYSLSQLQLNIENIIKKEISAALDKEKDSE